MRERLNVSLGELFDPALDFGQVSRVAEDEEDGVVAAQGTEDLGPFLPVERLRDGLGAARQGLHDEKVSRAFRANEERGQKSGERRPRVGVGRKRIVGAAVGVGHFDEAKLPDVTRESRLGDVEIKLEEQLAQLLLVLDPMLMHDMAGWRVWSGCHRQA